MIHVLPVSDRDTQTGYMKHRSQTGIHEVSESDRDTCSTCSRQEYIDPVVSKEKTISMVPPGRGGTVGQRNRK